MADGEDLKMFVLPSSSAEYRAVKEAFKRTVSKSVMKVGIFDCENISLETEFHSGIAHVKSMAAKSLIE